MTAHRRLAAPVALLALALAGPAHADGRATVEAFYTRLLNASGAADKTAEAERILAPAFQSIGDYSGRAKTREELAKQLDGFARLIPDLTWTVEEIIRSGDRYVVRGRASGTPKGPLFGVDGKGKSFTIMSIDIHEVADGKIKKVYHVEDWAGALRQLQTP